MVKPYDSQLLNSVTAVSLAFVTALWVAMSVCATLVFGEDVKVRRPKLLPCRCVCSRACADRTPPCAASLRLIAPPVLAGALPEAA